MSRSRSLPAVSRRGQKSEVRRHKAKSIAQGAGSIAKSEERGGQESGERQSFSSVIALNHAGNS